MTFRLGDFQAIIFDSDGVLVDSEIIHITVERELLSGLGLEYEHEAYNSRFVGLSNPDFYRELSKDFARHIGGSFPVDFEEKLQAKTWPRMEAELNAVQGVTTLLEVLEQPIAVASSAPIQKLQRKLEITDLFSRFAPHIYSVEHVTRGKPAPDLFLHAAKMLNVDPSKCAVIEDSIHGILAARAAGMTPIGFTGGSHADEGLPIRLKENGAAIVTGSYTQLLALL